MDLNEWTLDTESLSRGNDAASHSNADASTATAPAIDIDAFLDGLAATSDWEIANLPLPSSGASSSDSSSNSGGSSPFAERERSPESPHKSQDKQLHTSSKQPLPMTGRLDFRTTVISGAAAEVPPAEWRSMSSKDRRKLRNKISARNSRQKAKDYIVTLEQEVRQLKNERAEMTEELRRAKELVKQLTEENAQLRQQQQQQLVPAGDPQLLVSNLLNDLSIPMMTTWLSHTSMPLWDLPHVVSLSKDTRSSTYNQYTALLFQRYPLLAPALMSIVVDQAMTPAELLVSTLDDAIRQKEADAELETDAVKEVDDEQTHDQEEPQHFQQQEQNENSKKKREHKFFKRWKERSGREDRCGGGRQGRKPVVCTVIELYQDAFQYMLYGTKQRLLEMHEAKMRLLNKSTSTAGSFISRTNSLPSSSSSSTVTRVA